LIQRKRRNARAFGLYRQRLEGLRWSEKRQCTSSDFPVLGIDGAFVHNVPVSANLSPHDRSDPAAQCRAAHRSWYWPHHAASVTQAHAVISDAKGRQTYRGSGALPCLARSLAATGASPSPRLPVGIRLEKPGRRYRDLKGGVADLLRCNSNSANWVDLS